MHDDERVRTFEFGKRFFHRVEKRVWVFGRNLRVDLISHEFRYDFRIGLSVELGPIFAKFFRDLGVIFHDAVMREEELVVGIGMRVGVFYRNAAVRCPAGMRDSERVFRSLFSFVRSFVDQRRYFAYGFEGFDTRFLVSYGDSRGIVSAVFEPFETVEENAVGVFPASCVCEDSAHGRRGEKITPTLYLSDCRFKPYLENAKNPGISRGFPFDDAFTCSISPFSRLPRG